jgi:polygalacturonase
VKRRSFLAISAASMAAVPLGGFPAPATPGRRFSVTDFGAVGDGVTSCTRAFAAAIAACHAAGGGHVDVPDGTFATGAVHLLSNVDLHLEGGATIAFSTDPGDFLPTVYTRWQGIECYNYSSMIYAYGQRNVSVTGSGTLDGQASDSNWWTWNGDSVANDSWTTLQQMAATGVPVSKRVFGAGFNLRPNFLQFYRCQNVLVEGVTVVNSPMWEIHPVLCHGVTIRDVTVTCYGPNNDGCDPESCSDVLIEGCSFDAGDDCLAIKSGRGPDGLRVNVPSQNIVIRNCDFINKYGAIAIGSEMTGGVRNVLVTNCTMGGSQLHYGLYIKTNSQMGGFAEQIRMRDIAVSTLNHEVVSINLYHGGDDGTGPYPPLIRGIDIRNLTCQTARSVADIEGYPADLVRDVSLTDCTFTTVSQAAVLSDVQLKLSNVLVGGVPMTT